MQKVSNIKKRLDDVDFLISHGRYEAALLLLVTAISGSALKVFPFEQKPITKPKKTNGQAQKKRMTDGEKYKRFLRVRLQQIMGYDLPEEAYYWDEIPQFIVAETAPEDIIYHLLRCNDVHESGIPEDYHYIYSENSVGGDFGIEYSNGKWVFCKGFLSLLREVVIGAPCNGKEFGIKHWRFTPKAGVDLRGLIHELSQDLGLTPGRIDIFIQLIERSKLNENTVAELSDLELATILTKTLHTKLNGGAKSGLCMARAKEPLCTMEGGITLYGAEIFRKILSKGEVIDIAF